MTLSICLITQKSDLVYTFWRFKESKKQNASSCIWWRFFTKFLLLHFFTIKAVFQFEPIWG